MPDCGGLLRRGREAMSHLPSICFAACCAARRRGMGTEGAEERERRAGRAERTRRRPRRMAADVVGQPMSGAGFP